MPVKYALHPNPLTANPDDHRGVIRHGDRHTMDDVIDRMISSGSKRRPAINTFTDVTTGTTNEKLTPGGAGMIRGQRLKTDPADLEQGLFIIGSDSSELRVDKYIRNMPKELIVTLPETLPPPPFDLELRTHIRHASGIRTGRLDALLQLA